MLRNLLSLLDSIVNFYLLVVVRLMHFGDILDHHVKDTGIRHIAEAILAERTFH